MSKVKNPDRFVNLGLIFGKVYKILPTRSLVKIFWVSYDLRYNSPDESIAVTVIATYMMDIINFELKNRRKEHLLF